MISSLILLAIVIGIVAAVRAHRAGNLDPLRPASGRTHSRVTRFAIPTGTAERSELRVHLDDWIDAGLIDTPTAQTIERYELDHAPVPASRLPLAAEAVGYLGGVLVFAAVAMVTGNNWDSLTVPGRCAVLAVPTALAAAAGWWIGRSDDEPLQRLGSLLWGLAVVGVAATAGEVWYDVIHDADPPNRGTVLFPAAAAALAAAAFWAFRRQTLQVLALFATTVATVVGLVDALRSGDGDIPMIPLGLALLALAAAWTAGGLLDRLTPTLPVLVVAPALALISAQTIAGENIDLGLWVGIGVAVTLVGVGAARSAVGVLLVGTVGLFQWTPQIALHYLGDALGAEITLAVIGVLLLALAGTMVRLWPWFARRRHPPADVDSPIDDRTPTGE